MTTLCEYLSIYPLIYLATSLPSIIHLFIHLTNYPSSGSDSVYVMMRRKLKLKQAHPHHDSVSVNSLVIVQH